MKVYLGQTRAKKWGALHDELGFGVMVQPSEYPPNRTANGWAQDNEEFVRWKAGRPIDDDAFWRHILRVYADVQSGAVPSPDFVVLPDIVAGGAESFARSVSWIPWLAPTGWPLLFVVQDGMSLAQVESVIPDVDGLFVGGSSEWKWATGAAWVELAHRYGRPCHVGRVGTGRRARWAREIGADSWDSCIPLWSQGNLDAFLSGMRAELPGLLVDRLEESRAVIRASHIGTWRPVA